MIPSSTLRTNRALAIGLYAVIAGVIVALNLLDSPSEFGLLGDVGVTLGVIAAHLYIVSSVYRVLERRLTLVPLFVVAVVVGATACAALTWAVLVVFPGLADPTVPLSAEVINGALNGISLLAVYVLAIRHPDAVEEARLLRVEAELAALRARLEPHFLLNTLNAISGLVREEPDNARDALAALGELLSEALDQGASRTHPVADEVRWLRSYVTLMKARYGDSLEVNWRIGPGADARVVPRLLVQPIVENAVLHGIAAALPGRLDIAAEVDDQRRLVFTVTNTGPAPQVGRRGHGLDLVTRRLALEVPGATFSLSATPDGAEARVVLPASDGQSL
jgi:hypothetical protein